MVATQSLASGGIWLNIGGTQMLIDPGPGSIVQATSRKLDPEKLSAIVLSHRHLDHSADANIMIEAMTRGGFQKRGRFFAPADALEGEPVIFSYLRSYLDGVEVLEEGKSYIVGNVSFSTPVRHVHPVETYGLLFRGGGHTFAYIADSRYFDGLCQSYASDLLIINVVFVDNHISVDHLAVPDAERLIAAIRPKVAILTHFGVHMWQARPSEIAEKLSTKTGVRVIAAQDGMEFSLSEID